jgi:hypothetical protein
LYEEDGMDYLAMNDEYGRQVPATWHLRWMFLMQLHPLLGALAIFAPLAGAIVYLFLQYQLYLIMTGVTTSESFKWEDISEAIHHKRITTISPHVLRFNQEYKPGKTLQDFLPKELKGKKIDFEKDQVSLTDVKQLRNIYHQGVMRNFWDIFFPKKL